MFVVFRLRLSFLVIIFLFVKIVMFCSIVLWWLLKLGVLIVIVVNVLWSLFIINVVKVLFFMFLVMINRGLFCWIICFNIGKIFWMLLIFLFVIKMYGLFNIVFILFELVIM